MSSKPSPKRTASKATISHPKQQAKRSVATKLWVADDKLFHEIAGRRHTKPAELLREIVHDWAVTFRLSRHGADATELDLPARTIDEKILVEQLRPVNETLAKILSQITPVSDSKTFPNLDPPVSFSQPAAGTFNLHNLTEQLASMNEQLALLRAFAVVHYMLSGQVFINTWAGLYFSRYIAEQFLMTEFKNNYEEEATTRRDEARLDALEWLKQMTLELGYPVPFKPILWTPPE